MTDPNEIGVNDPEELEAAGAPASGEIAASTTLGAVHLTVADLERSLAFYRNAVGLELLGRADGTAAIGVGDRELIVAVEEPGAGPRAGYTGLYHVALLLPERSDLARWLAHASRDRVPLTGMSDHFVSEALYLRDPDGHGLEIYWDRPRESWEGQVAARMTTMPLDAADLMAEIGDPAADRFDGIAAGTIVGHVHLKVASIPETDAFYRDVLGFALDGDAGRRGHLPRRRRLPPPHRRERLGEPRRAAPAAGNRSAPARHRRSPRRGRARPHPRPRARRRPRGRRGSGRSRRHRSVGEPPAALRPLRRPGGQARGNRMKVAVVGHVEACAFATVDHVPVPGEIVEAEEGWEQAAGGGAVAAVQLARLAGECLFLTAIADDRFGRAAKRDLEALGLRVEAACRPATQRRAFVHLDATGERTITVTGDRLAPAIADPLPWAELESCDAVYFTAGDRGAAVAARKATRMVATIRAKEGLSGSGVELDVLVASAGDRGERYVSGAIEPLPRAAVLTAGVEGGLTENADGTRLAGPLRLCRARSSTSTAPATRSPAA